MANVLFGSGGPAEELGGFGAPAHGAGADGFYSAPAHGASSGAAFGGQSGYGGSAAYGASGAYQRHAPYGGAGPSTGSFGAVDDEDYSNEPPLLEELGVDFRHILHKVTAVLMLSKPIDRSVMQDADLAGPLVFCLVLGVCLLLTGKLHFGYIYGFGLLGCMAMYTVVNLMQGEGSQVVQQAAAANAAASAAEGVTGSAGNGPVASLDFSLTFSMLGYCLLPIVLLAALAIFVSLQGTLGVVLGIAAIAWSTLSAARFFEAALGMSDRKWLIAYPAGLFYAVFALMAIF